MGIIAKASFYLSSKTLLTLHYSPVYPYLMYCNVAWSSICCSNLNCIYLLQKRIEGRIAKARYLTNTVPLYLANSPWHIQHCMLLICICITIIVCVITFVTSFK